MGGIDGEMVFAFATVMSGITQLDVDGMTGRRIAEVVKIADSKSVSAAEPLAEWASAFFTDVGAFFDLRFWQVGGIDNTFYGVGNVLTGARHSKFFLELKPKRGKIQIFRLHGKSNLTVVLTLSHSLSKIRRFICGSASVKFE